MKDKYPYVIKVNVIDNKKKTYYCLIYANNMSEAIHIVEDYYGVDYIEDCTIKIVGCAGDLFEVNKETAKLLIEGEGKMYGR